MNTSSSSSPFDSFKSKKSPHASIAVTPNESAWSSKTPEKPTNPPRVHLTRSQRSLRSVSQVREAAKKLMKSDPKPSVSSDLEIGSDNKPITPKPRAGTSIPEKYEILEKMFNSLQSSIRLLKLKNSTSTFANISRKVESLVDRRFSYSHLAQIKFILPEAIEIKKILVRDERTSCMKPDLLVSLDFGVVQNDDKMMMMDLGNANIRLTKLFRSRLVKFCKSNSEGTEVPEEDLPEPFNQSSQMTLSNVIQKPKLGSVQDTTHTLSEQLPAVASHMPPSFKRRFSKLASSQNVVSLEPKLQGLTESPGQNVNTVCILSKQDSPTKVDCVATAPSTVKWSAKLPETPVKNFDFDKKGDLSSDGTPAKLILTPFSATPAQTTRTPVRCFMTPDDESMMSPSKSAPSKLTRRSSGRKSLTFDTPVKNRAPVKRVSVDDDDDDLRDILSEDLIKSIKEKERKAIEEKDPAITQAKWRKQMLAALPKLFDILLFYFQSINRSVITKEELMHMIISSQLEIVDRREVDEQLRLLQELAPEWICEKMASTGDLLLCVNKLSSPELIRTRLSEAN
uniref:CDT1-like protein a, chloroplastic n=1 Tax=Erigeron canadensis TaxID=72917 RepID=UPI001CB89F93|nr:CDT1-like protein a, chloroplastic [Erigeron canadensis]